MSCSPVIIGLLDFKLVLIGIGSFMHVTYNYCTCFLKWSPKLMHEIMKHNVSVNMLVWLCLMNDSEQKNSTDSLI